MAWAISGNLGASAVQMTTRQNHHERSGGVFVPSWVFTTLVSVLIFSAGAAAAYFRFEMATESRLARLEVQIEQLKQYRDRDLAEIKELLKGVHR